MRVHLIASKVTDSVVYGFLAAAARLGLDLTVLSDQPEAHQRSIVAARGRPRPGAIGALAEIGEPAVAGYDPWDVRALIPQLAGLPAADAVLTNSDHLQTQTGVASEDVVLVHDPQELARRASEIARRRPGERLIAEEYLTDQLRTAEVLGGGTTTWVLGVICALGPDPAAVERAVRDLRTSGAREIVS